MLQEMLRKTRHNQAVAKMAANLTPMIRLVRATGAGLPPIITMPTRITGQIATFSAQVASKATGLPSAFPTKATTRIAIVATEADRPEETRAVASTATITVGATIMAIMATMEVNSLIMEMTAIIRAAVAIKIGETIIIVNKAAIMRNLTKSKSILIQTTVCITKTILTFSANA